MSFTYHKYAESSMNNFVKPDFSEKQSLNFITAQTRSDFHGAGQGRAQTAGINITRNTGMQVNLNKWIF